MMLFCTIFAPVKKVFALIALLALLLPAAAQSNVPVTADGKYLVGVSKHKGEKIPHIVLPDCYIFAPLKFKNQRERNIYGRLVRDVKQTLPLAIERRDIIHDTERHLSTLTTEKERKKYLDHKEKELKEIYTPKMRKLTFRQGKLLIKLIDRECDQSAYKLIKLFMGSFKAVFYQSFASLFGASLKKTYDATGEDFMIERVIILVSSGQL